MNLKKVELPAFAQYKANTHHCVYSWLAYQAAPNEVRLLSFNSDASIKDVFILDVPTEPIQCIRLAYDYQHHKIYVGIAFLTRFMVLEKNKLLTQFALPLNCNIVDFEKGFVSVEGIADGRQVYFIFITSNGRIVTQPVGNVENRAVIDFDIDSRVTSFCAQETWGYIGTEKGEVLKVDLNTRKVISRYHTKSSFPIINIRINQDIIVLGTCDGELHVLNFNLEVITIISAHTGMIVLLHADQKQVYSVGDDAVVRVWTYSNKTFLEKISKDYSQRPNLVFTVEGRGYINFYESLKYEEI